MKSFLDHLMHQFNTPFTNPVLVFSTVLLIILLAPLLLRKIRVPGIIGLIISGVVIGPHGLNLIQRNDAVILFSTIGLLYIMFIAGLELDLKRFVKNRNKSILFGFLTFILPLGLGFPVCYFILGYGFTTSLLTSSMFATHTLVAYPIVNRMGLSKIEPVAITVGGTILTDTAVLILLAVITASAAGNLDTSFALRLFISFVIFLIIVLTLIPKVTKWFFKRLEGEKISHFVFVLSMLFLSAFLAELAGLEPIIGAFAVGLSLNRLIPTNSQLMNRIEFTGNALFIPFFLISVGMLVDLRVLLYGYKAVFVAVVLTGVALSGKWLAAFITSILFRMPSSYRRLIYGLSASHAAATLAVIMVGYRMGVIDDNILNGTIVLILVTCLVATVATESAARKIALDESPDLDHRVLKSQSPKILVPLANPNTMSVLLHLAFRLSSNEKKDAVTGMAVINEEDSVINYQVATTQILQAAQKIGVQAHQQLNLLSIVDHNIASGIKKIANSISATDIVIGLSQKTNFSDLLFGTNLRSIITQTNQNLFVCRLTPPLERYNHLHWVLPDNIEREQNFDSLACRITELVNNLKLELTIYCSSKARSFIEKTLIQLGIKTNFKCSTFLGWSTMLSLARPLTAQDLLILSIPKEGMLSYNAAQESLLRRINIIAESVNLILLYPGNPPIDSDGMLTPDIGSGDLGSRVNKLKWSLKSFLNKESETD